MNLFKKSFVEKIKDICVRLNEASLRDDDLLLKFNSKVSEIKDVDVEFIRLLEVIARDGRISETQKVALLNQLIFLLKRLESLKFEQKDELVALKCAIEDILQTELTTERLGVEVHNFLYHGSGISGISKFSTFIDELDYYGSNTLGEGVYCGDNKKLGINYALYRYGKYSKDESVIGKYGDRIKATLYTFKLKKGRNFFADLSNPIKLRAIYSDLSNYLNKRYESEVSNPARWRISMLLSTYRNFLDSVIRNKTVFQNLRAFLHTGGRSMMSYVIEFLKERGYRGLRCHEGGELFESVFSWERSMSYVVFDPDDIEIVKEEHFGLSNGRVIEIK